jgi:hypothetical protein
MQIVGSRSAGTEQKLSSNRARSQFVAASCRLDLEDRHDGVAECTLSGERLWRKMGVEVWRAFRGKGVEWKGA